MFTQERRQCVLSSQRSDLRALVLCSICFSTIPLFVLGGKYGKKYFWACQFFQACWWEENFLPLWNVWKKTTITCYIYSWDFSVTLERNLFDNYASLSKPQDYLHYFSHSLFLCLPRSIKKHQNSYFWQNFSMVPNLAHHMCVCVCELFQIHDPTPFSP